MKRKRTIFIIAIACLSLISLIFAINNLNGTGTTVDAITPSNPQDGPGLVVPESPIGTLGLITGLATAAIIFVMAKKR